MIELIMHWKFMWYHDGGTVYTKENVPYSECRRVTRELLEEKYLFLSFYDEKTRVCKVIF